MASHSSSVPGGPHSHAPSSYTSDLEAQRERSAHGRLAPRGAPKRSSSRVKQMYREFVEAHRNPKCLGKAPCNRRSLLAIMKASYLNMFLILIPVSWVLHFHHANNVATFIVSFFAIIPLAGLLAFATDALAIRFGNTLSYLIHGTIRNLVEIIVAAFALARCELQVAQTSLVGSVMCNLLLVTGVCLLAGGIRFSEQRFDRRITHLNTSMLVLGFAALVIPAALDLARFLNMIELPNVERNEGSRNLLVDRIVSVVMSLTYAGYILFQLFSHRKSDDEVNANTARHRQNHDEREGPASGPTSFDAVNSVVTPVDTAPTLDSSTTLAALRTHEDSEERSPEPEATPKINVLIAIMLLCIADGFILVTVMCLVDSIQGPIEKTPLNKQFIGFILLPILVNASDFCTAISTSYKDELDKCLGIAETLIIQMLFFTIPFVNILAWITNRPLSFPSGPLESTVLVLSAIMIVCVFQDGRSSWLEGLIFLSLYGVMATTFWFYPESGGAGAPETCR